MESHCELDYNIMRSKLNILFVVVFTVGMGVFLIGTPKYIDDYLYISHYRDWFLMQGVTYPEKGGDLLCYGFPLRETWNSWRDHYMLDNGRLGNIVATPLLLLPKWIGSMIALCCLIFSIWGSLRLAGIYSIQSVLIPYALCMWMFLFPWWENMGALTYQFNYLFSMALCTWLLLRLFKAKPEPTGVFFSGWQLFFLGLFAGCSHEGMSVPILVGLLFLLLVFKRARTSRYYYSIAGLFTGILILVMSPGMNIRVGNDLNVIDLRFYSVEFVYLSLPFVAMTILVLYKKGRAIVSDMFTMFCIVSGCISLSFVLFISGSVRVGWWSIFVSITGILYQFNIYFRRLKITSINAAYIVGILLLIPCFIHLYSISENALFNRKMMQEVFGREDVADKETWFGNVLTLREMPLTCGITGATFSTIGMMYCDYYFKNQTRDNITFSAIIPIELAWISKDCGNSIDGDSPIRECGGYMFMPSVSDEPQSTLTFLFDYGGYQKMQTVYRYRFISRADGKPYDWVVPAVGFPWLSWYIANFKSISNINMLH